MEQTRQIKQFPFYDFYAEILNGLNDESAGRIARLMCEYMFTDNAVAEIKDDKNEVFSRNEWIRLSGGGSESKPGQPSRLAGQRTFADDLDRPACQRKGTINLTPKNN